MNKFLDFMNSAVTAYHAINTLESELRQNGFTELEENTEWNLSGDKFYVKRNNTSILAFKLSNSNLCNPTGFNITSSHSDSPTFKIKPHNLIDNGKYLKLNTEVYGGPILSTWLDRPLSFAGRVLLKENNEVTTRYVYIDKDILVIPNIAPHMHPEVAKGMQYNPQDNMLPILGMSGSGLNINKIISENLNIKEEDILDYDLFLVNREKAKIVGYNDEFILSPRLDDLACAYTSLEGFLKANNDNRINVFVCFDNEEVGSHTRQGAASDFLSSNLERLLYKLNVNLEQKQMMYANTFMLSCDNAHAVHPNMPQKTDQLNNTYLNGGIVLKYNANQSYTTDGLCGAHLRMIAQKANVKLQVFTNRSDVRGGSTLGNISNTQVSLHSCDIGLPQLAMHSSTELCGKEDINSMIELLTAFYNSNTKF